MSLGILTVCLLLNVVLPHCCNAQASRNGSGINTMAYAATLQCQWKRCTPIGYAAQVNNYTVDCCSLQLPLSYSIPQRQGGRLRTIAVSMVRLTPPRPSGNTLFVFTGGPGNSGFGLVNVLPNIVQPQFGITMIVPDHRGTGLSTRLACNDNDSQVLTPACVPYLISKFGEEGLRQFSMTNTAHDLAIQIQVYKSRFPGRIAVLGSSYGTHLLNRFLTIYPRLIDSAVMDGVVHPLLGSNSRSNLWQSIIAEQFLTYCQVLPECNRYFLRETPQNAMRNILRQLDTNNQRCIRDHFSQHQITSVKIRTLFNNMFVPAEMYWDRTVIPAIIFRLGRCNNDDVRALQFFFKKSFSVPPVARDPNGDGFLISEVLRFHVSHAEEWVAQGEPEVDLETVSAWYNSSIWGSNNIEPQARLRPIWPRTQLDEYATDIASFSPLMMISGLLDASTYIHEVAQLATLTVATRTFHPVPLGGHVTGNMAQAGQTCPSLLMMSHLFPSIFGNPNPSCLREMPTTIDFVGSTPRGQQASRTYLNVTRPFEN